MIHFLTDQIYGKSPTQFFYVSDNTKKVLLRILETGPRENLLLLLLDNESPCLPMASLANCGVSEVFLIPKLRYLCHKFKLFYQKNGWFCSNANKKNIFNVLNNFFFQPLHQFQQQVFSEKLSNKKIGLKEIGPYKCLKYPSVFVTQI